MSDEADLFQRRDVTVRADTFNEEDRTVEIIWAAGAAVKRYSWDEGYYMEELSMDPAHIRLGRFKSGMSLLDSHNAMTMAARLGTVLPKSVRIQNGKAYATVKLSRKPAAEELLQDLRDGHPFPVSVGYKTHAHEKREGDSKSLPTLRAIDWEPLELSAVPVPADAGAHSRKEPPVKTPTKTRKSPPIDPADDDLESLGQDEASDQARAAERQRTLDIQALGSRLNVPSRVMRRAIEDGASVDDFREEIAERRVREQERGHQTRGHFDTERYSRSADVREQAVVAIAALLGAKPAADAPTDLVGRSVLEIGRAVLDASGTDMRSVGDRDLARILTGTQPRYNARSYHTTSDFPLLLSESVQRAALERFQAQPSVLQQFSRKRNQKDFRPTHFVRPGEAPDLERVDEHGEIKSGTIAFDSESFRIFNWGKAIGFSFEALVNDDLSTLEDTINSFVDSGTNRVGDEFFAILSENAFGGRKTRDGHNFFSAEHSNLGTAAAIGVAAVGAAEEAMRLQKNVSGVAGRAGISPTTLVVGPKRVVAARKFLAEIAAATTDDVNPFAGKLGLAIENRYTGTGWWLFGDKPAFIHGFLEGSDEGPKIESSEGWKILGTEWRAYMSFGAGAYDYRAAYFNPGA